MGKYKVTAMKKVVLGAVGAGRIGKLHADNILGMPGVRLKLIADPYIDEDWARSRGLQTTPDPQDLFSDPQIEAVLIFSPSSLHAEQIIAAAQANKHISVRNRLPWTRTISGRRCWRWTVPV